jgi:hypothetical protein
MGAPPRMASFAAFPVLIVTPWAPAGTEAATEVADAAAINSLRVRFFFTGHLPPRVFEGLIVSLWYIGSHTLFEALCIGVN